MELERDVFGAVSHDPERGILELEWFESTASLVPAAGAGTSEPAPEGPATFPTGYFDSREKVDEWVAGN